MPNTPSISDADLTLIDRYLSGSLTDAERAVFEGRIAAEPALAGALASQRSLDESLRRSVAGPRSGLAELQLANALAAARREDGPDGEDTGASVGGKLGIAHLWQQITVRFWRPATLVAAAGIATLAAAVAFWAGALPLGSSSARQDPFSVAAAEEFRATIEQSDPAAIEALITEKLNGEIRLPRGDGIVYAGIRTDMGETPLSIGILAQVAGQRVVLIVSRAAAVEPSRDVATRAEADGVFRHEANKGPVGGSLRLVEWSRSPKPILVGRVVGAE